MTLVKRKYLKVYEGIMTGASVELEITPNVDETHQVIIQTEKRPFLSQGQVEGGYDHWNRSAKQALETALKRLDAAQKVDVTIKKLDGKLFIDTNNASVGIACVLGLWDHLGIKQEKEQIDRIHQFVRENWKNDIEDIPNFELVI